MEYSEAEARGDGTKVADSNAIPIGSECPNATAKETSRRLFGVTLRHDSG